jgi:hypothetical protein
MGQILAVHGGFLSVTMGVVVLFVGKALNERLAPLRRFNIPEPVTGGLLFSAAFGVVYLFAGVKVDFELTEDGAFTINKQPYSLSQLESAFHQIYDTRPAKLLFIKAAPNRKYGDVMQAMDIAHGAGVQVIGFTPPAPGQH